MKMKTDRQTNSQPAYVLRDKTEKSIKSCKQKEVNRKLLSSQVQRKFLL